MGRKYYVIEINFDQQGSFDPLEGTMRMSQAKDAFILSPSSLLIRYSRAKTQNIESAFNKPRRKHIRKLWLVYYALTGHIPTIHTVRYGLSEIASKIVVYERREKKTIACPKMSVRPRND